jgi:hypothetical protein
MEESSHCRYVSDHVPWLTFRVSERRLNANKRTDRVAQLTQRHGVRAGDIVDSAVHVQGGRDGFGGITYVDWIQT